MLFNRFFSLLLISAVLPLSIAAQTTTPWALEGGFTISHFQQQVKAEVGDPSGEELVFNAEFGLILNGMYSFNNYFAAGLFTQFDFGERNMAIYDGFDDEGKTKVKNKVGGAFTEFWIGPMVRGKWKQLTLDLGYAVYGSRSDDGRDDIPSESGNTSEAFKTHPTIAWLIALGGNVPVASALDIYIRIEYRFRYYDKRGSEGLAGGIEHGTQSIAPIIGVSWRL